METIEYHLRKCKLSYPRRKVVSEEEAWELYFLAYNEWNKMMNDVASGKPVDVKPWMRAFKKALASGYIVTAVVTMVEVKET